MKTARILICLYTFMCLTSCKKEKQTIKNPMVDITKQKWLTYDGSLQSPWNATVMPVILDFNNDRVALNFGNYFHKFSILEDNLYLDGKASFEVVYNDNNTLTLHNNDEVRNYFPLSEGTYTDIDKSTLESIIQNNTWLFKDLNAKFSSREIDFYDNQGEFVKGGFYSTVLYNKNILMFVNIDGEIERETYIIDLINKDKITLKKVLNENEYQTIDLTTIRKNQ